MIIIGFNDKLEIGKIYTRKIKTRHADGVVKATFRVMKEGTLEEWINNNAGLTESDIVKAKKRLENGAAIYWIHVD